MVQTDNSVNGEEAVDWPRIAAFLAMSKEDRCAERGLRDMWSIDRHIAEV